MVAVSDAHLQATRKSREELAGRGLFEVFTGSDDPAQATTLHNLRASFARVLASRWPNSMPVQKYNLPAPGGLEERFWSPVNSPVLNGDAVQYIIHRVEDVTEFVRLKRIEAEHGMLTDDARIRADQVESELILRSRQLAEPQRLLRESVLPSRRRPSEWCSPHRMAAFWRRIKHIWICSAIPARSLLPTIRVCSPIPTTLLPPGRSLHLCRMALERKLLSKNATSGKTARFFGPAARRPCDVIGRGTPASSSRSLKTSRNARPRKNDSALSTMELTSTSDFWPPMEQCWKRFARHWTSPATPVTT